MSFLITSFESLLREIENGFRQITSININLASPFGDIASYFANLSKTLYSTIDTIPKAIYNGLIALGIWFWKALNDFASLIGTSLSTAFSWIWNGLKDLGSYLYQGLALAYRGLIDFGTWIWSSIVYIGQYIVSLFEWIWKSITSFFSQISKYFIDYFNKLSSMFDTYFYNFSCRMRDKIAQIFMVDTTLAVAWKGIDNMASGKMPIKSGIARLIFAPLLGIGAGALAEAIIPKCKPKTFTFIPTTALESLELTLPEFKKPELLTGITGYGLLKIPQKFYLTESMVMKYTAKYHYQETFSISEATKVLFEGYEFNKYRLKPSLGLSIVSKLPNEYSLTETTAFSYKVSAKYSISEKLLPKSELTITETGESSKVLKPSAKLTYSVYIKTGANTASGSPSEVTPTSVGESVDGSPSKATATSVSETASGSVST